MKNIFLTSLVVFSVLFFASCEKEITIDIENGENQLIIDAFLNDKLQKQVIQLSQTKPFFGNTLPIFIDNAVVKLEDSEGNVYNFTYENEGKYVWTPTTEALIIGGRTYDLTVEYNGQKYTAQSYANFVPQIDSINYQKVGSPFGGDSSYIAEMVVVDLPGQPDYYWVKTTINDTLQNTSDDLVISVDGAFNEQSNNDGRPFIVPIAANFGLSENDVIIKEVWSINPETRRFFTELQNQSIEGALGALFATPIANVRTNIVSSSSDPKLKALGWFSVSLTSVATQKLIFNSSKRVTFSTI
jgi:hypothetical protein